MRSCKCWIDTKNYIFMRSFIWLWWAFAKKRQIKDHAKLISYTESHTFAVRSLDSSQCTIHTLNALDSTPLIRLPKLIPMIVRIRTESASLGGGGGGGVGGGGGALRYLGGRIRSLSKLKNTPKALISGQKSPLILIKRWLFPLNKNPFFYQNTDIGWTGTRILTLDFIILCVFSGSKWRQQTR